MNIIALVIFGFVLLGFVWLFRKKNNREVKMILKQNRNVQPLLQQRSVKNKYQVLLEQFTNNPDAKNALLKVRKDLDDDAIPLEVYYQELERLDELFMKRHGPQPNPSIKAKG